MLKCSLLFYYGRIRVHKLLGVSHSQNKRYFTIIIKNYCIFKQKSASSK